jgi:hypothetical protein
MIVELDLSLVISIAFQLAAGLKPILRIAVDEEMNVNIGL